MSEKLLPVLQELRSNIERRRDELEALLTQELAHSGDEAVARKCLSYLEALGPTGTARAEAVAAEPAGAAPEFTAQLGTSARPTWVHDRLDTLESPAVQNFLNTALSRIHVYKELEQNSALQFAAGLADRLSTAPRVRLVYTAKPTLQFRGAAFFGSSLALAFAAERSLIYCVDTKTQNNSIAVYETDFDVVAFFASSQLSKQHFLAATTRGALLLFDFDSRFPVQRLSTESAEPIVALQRLEDRLLAANEAGKVFEFECVTTLQLLKVRKLEGSLISEPLTAYCETEQLTFFGTEYRGAFYKKAVATRFGALPLPADSAYSELYAVSEIASNANDSLVSVLCVPAKLFVYSAAEDATVALDALEALSVSCVAWHPQKTSVLATGSLEGQVAGWTWTDSGAELLFAHSVGEPVAQVAFDPVRSHLCVITGANNVFCIALD